MHNTRILVPVPGLRSFQISKANAQAVPCATTSGGISGLSGLTPHQQMQHKELHLWQQTIHEACWKGVGQPESTLMCCGKVWHLLVPSKVWGGGKFGRLRQDSCWCRDVIVVWNISGQTAVEPTKSHGTCHASPKLCAKTHKHKSAKPMSRSLVSPHEVRMEHILSNPVGWQ